MFIKRNKEGHIVALSTEEFSEFKGVLEGEESEVQEFLKNKSFSDSLVESDADFIRVIDDLINLMIDKHLIQFTDLPKAAQRKLLNRESLRESSSDLNLINHDDDESIQL